MPPILIEFQELWSIATSAASACNGLVHHPCCDVWTTRAAKLKRASHRTKIQWREILNSLDKSCEDKKQALLAKMTEEGWRLPALLNEACKYQLSQPPRPRDPSKVDQPEQPPQELLPPLAPHHFTDLRPACYLFQDPGTIYSNQAHSDHPTSVSQSQLFKHSLCHLSPTSTMKRTLLFIQL